MGWRESIIHFFHIFIILNDESKGSKNISTTQKFTVIDILRVEKQNKNLIFMQKAGDFDIVFSAFPVYTKPPEIWLLNHSDWWSRKISRL